MRMHIVDDYDADCEIYPENTPVWWMREKEVYDIPDGLVKEYEAVNKRREELKEEILLIKRRGPL